MRHQTAVYLALAAATLTGARSAPAGPLSTSLTAVGVAWAALALNAARQTSH